MSHHLISTAMRSALIAHALIAASAQVGAAELPQPIVAAIGEQRKICEPEKVTLKPGFISRKEINNDRVLDYVLDYSGFQCGDNETFFCGSAGCTMQVFASSNGEFTKVLDENVQNLRFKTVRGRPAMLLSLHGSACGKTGVETCSAALFWNGSRFSPAR